MMVAPDNANNIRSSASPAKLKWQCQLTGASFKSPHTERNKKETKESKKLRTGAEIVIRACNKWAANGGTAGPPISAKFQSERLRKEVKYPR